MARVTSVNYEDVAAACVNEMCNGNRVTFDAVYAAIGRRGSAMVVSEMIKRWLSDTGERLRAAQHSSDFINSPVVRALLQAAEHIQEASKEYADFNQASETAKHRQELAQAQAVTTVTQEALAQANQKIELLEHSLTIKGVEIEGLLERLNDQGQRIAAQEATIREKDNSLLALREEHGNLVASMAAAQQQHADELVRIHAGHEAALNDQRARLTDERNRDAEIAAGERKHLMAETDRMRQDFAIKLEHATSEASIYKTRSETTFTTLQETRVNLRAAEVSLAALQSELREFRQQQALFMQNFTSPAPAAEQPSELSPDLPQEPSSEQ